LEGPPLKNYWGQKCARFRTTSDFDRRYLRNGWRYPKLGMHLMDSDSIFLPQGGAVPSNFYMR